MTLRIEKEITEIEIEKKGIALGREIVTAGVTKREIEGEITFEIETKEVGIDGRIEVEITEIIVITIIEVDIKPFARTIRATRPSNITHIL